MSVTVKFWCQIWHRPGNKYISQKVRKEWFEDKNEYVLKDDLIFIATRKLFVRQDNAVQNDSFGSN